MVIFCSGSPSINASRFAAIAEHFGIETRIEKIEESGEGIAGRENAAVFDIESLSRLGNFDSLLSEFRALTERKANILMLVASASPKATELLGLLSLGAVTRVVDLETKIESVVFPSGKGLLNAQFGGYRYERAGKPAIGLEFASANEDGYRVEMSLDETPAFAVVKERSAELFIWSSSEVFDIHKPLAAELEFEQSKDEYVPAIIYLRAAMGERCWSNPVSDAGFVIDDPLLQKRYGFIDFPELLSSARKNGYVVTLAFIPWNHQRTKQKEIARFLDHSDCFNICIHGCDHNNNEYGAADYDLLLAKNSQALSRMQSHRERTGMDFEPIVVCPQEKCSDEGWRAFSDSHHLLAMVNTGCIPRNLRKPDTYAADLLLPAQDAFYGFPIFKRHYHGDMAPFATDLFLGKPAILVEHHEFFRAGLKPLEEFVQDLKTMEPEIRWRSMTDVVKETHLRKRTDGSRLDVRFFAREFEFTRPGGDASPIRFQKRVADPDSVRSVTVNGAARDFNIIDGFAQFEIPGREAERFRIGIEFKPVQAKKAYSFGLNYKASVAIRRSLSELRDNVIARNQSVLNLGQSIMGLFGLTGKR